MTISIQRACEYTQQMSVVGVADGTSWKLFWGFRKSTRAADVRYTKTVVQAGGEITVELSATEANEILFTDGYLGVFKIDASTGRKTHYATYNVRVSDNVAGSDSTATSALQVATPYTFNFDGAAQVGKMQGKFTATADGTITSLYCGAQNAPLGSSIIFTIYKNGSITAETITLAAGDNDNSATKSISIAQGDFVETYITQVGDIGSGVGVWRTSNFQAAS